jgi:hypothetical protein
MLIVGFLFGGARSARARWSAGILHRRRGLMCGGIRDRSVGVGC